MAKAMLVFKKQHGILQIQPWFFKNSQGNGKTTIGFQKTVRGLTNTRLLLKTMLAGIEKRGFLNRAGYEDVEGYGCFLASSW